MKDCSEDKEENYQKRPSITIYLSMELLDKIDDYIYFKKKQLPLEKRRLLNRSSLVNITLDALVGDYSVRKDKSILDVLIEGDVNGD